MIIVLDIIGSDPEENSDDVAKLLAKQQEKEKLKELARSYYEDQLQLVVVPVVEEPK